MGNTIRIKLGKKIKEIRHKRGLTQEKLAELASMDYKYLQRLEGKLPPAVKIDTIEKLSRALSIQSWELLYFK